MFRKKIIDLGLPICNLIIELDISSEQNFFRPDKILENYKTIRIICDLIEKSKQTVNGKWILTDRGYLKRGHDEDLPIVKAEFEVGYTNKDGINELHDAYINNKNSVLNRPHFQFKSGMGILGYDAGQSDNVSYNGENFYLHYFRDSLKLIKN